MSHYKYLIIGGGMAGDAAVRGIREVDQQGTIGVIGAEPEPPYNRPPLTKGLWKGRSFDKIWRRTDSLGAELNLGRWVRTLDPQNKRVIDEQGTEYTYDRLLLATGGTPLRLPFDRSAGGAGKGSPDEREIIYFRTVDTYRRLRALSERADGFAVVGAGFIGSEIAAALAMNGKKVSMIFIEKYIGERVFPEDLARFVTNYYREKGVELLPEHTVAGVERRGEQVVVRAKAVHGDHETEIEVSAVVAGLGIRPNTELATAAGLAVENGIVVDESLRTSDPDIYAAGDVASFYNPALDMRLRVEHEDNANTMGKMAGEAMAGRQIRYDHLPFFYSDLFDLGYEAVGELDSRLETVADWQEPFRKGVIYYLRDGRVRGVLLWDTWEQVEAARRLIAEPGPFRPSDLMGRLPA